MAYNRENLLLKIIDIQRVTLEHTRRGVTQEWVFHQLIAPKYHISKATYYNYLATPAEMELRRLHERREREKQAQPTLFGF
jgi:hypothetical protein